MHIFGFKKYFFIHKWEENFKESSQGRLSLFMQILVTFSGFAGCSKIVELGLVWREAGQAQQRLVVPQSKLVRVLSAAATGLLGWSG